MKKNYLKSILVFILLIFTCFSYGQSFWTKTSESEASRKELNFRKSQPKNAHFYNLDLDALKLHLSDAPKRNTSSNLNQKLVSFPTSKDTFETFAVMEASIMDDVLQAKYPNTRTYVGKSIESPESIIRFSITSRGLHTISFNINSGIEVIDPYTKDAANYIVYSRSSLPTLNEFWECGFKGDENLTDYISTDRSAFNANDGKMRTFRLAVATTIEYSEYHWDAAGLTNANTVAERKAAVHDAIVITMNRVNFIYERDLSITMELIANNDDVIFITSDSFSNDSATALINESQTVIDGIIGNANYDIGHTFSTGGGGLAQLNSPCRTGFKARGITGSPNPVGDLYDVDYVAHEMGHQYGAPHTFNGNAGNCAGANRTADNAYEPGSGSTIMAYAGICSPQNVQNNSDAYFHQKSIQMMWDNITTGFSQCASQVDTFNAAPTASLTGNNYTIPSLTPYKLTGSSTDTDGIGSHTYTWEQFDLGPAGLPAEGNFTGPLVRSFEGTNNPTRYIPRMIDILSSGGVSTTWEKLSSVSRPINFRLTVRDNDVRGGQTAVTEDMAITVSNLGGPFTVTSQNTAGITWTTGETKTITWDVAGTTAAPINTANVNILLSTDGGMTYDTVLASNVPNDGSHDITVPSVAGGSCRVMVEGAGNIFFNINSESFAVNATVTCTQFTSGNLGIAIPDGIGANQQGAAIFDGIMVTGLPGNIVGDEMKVNVDITHTYIQDMVVQLIAPDGTTFNTLWARDCDGENDFDVVFSDDGSDIVCAQPTVGNYKPNTPFTTFDGQSINGTWTIAMADFYNGDTGTLNDWYIEICTTTLNIADNTLNNNLSIYPNPNKGSFTVALSSGIVEDVSIDVYDIRGRQVYGNIYNGSDRFNQTIDLDVQSGIYLVKVSNGNFSETKKIIIE